MARLVAGINPYIYQNKWPAQVLAAMHGQLFRP